MKHSLFSRALLLLASSLLALPVFAAIEPELTLNGYFAGSLRYLETDFEKTTEDRFEGTNNASRVTAKASVKTGFATAYAVYERGLRNDKAGIEQVRQVYLGVDTDYGRLLAGKKASEYRLTGERIDPFYDTSVVGFNGRAYAEGGSYGLSNLTNGFSRNMVSYTTPLLFDTLSFNGAAFINDKDSPNDQVDYSGGGLFTTKGFGEGSQVTVGGQYLEIKNPGSFAAGNTARNELLGVGGSPGLSTSYRVHAAYAATKFSVGVSFESVDVKAENKARRYGYGSVTYALTETLRAAASYGRIEVGSNGPAIGGDGYSLGLFRKFSDSVNGYIAGRNVDLDRLGNTSSIALGLSVSLGGKLYPWGSGSTSTTSE